MPVIRYRTRDLTRLLPGTARSMRRMEKVTGRSDDMMIVRGVNVFPTQIEELLLKIEPLSAHYQVVLTREGRMDDMEVVVEIRPEADTAANRSQSAALLGQTHQGQHRRDGESERRRCQRHRALAGQGQAHRRQAPQGLKEASMARPRAADHDLKRRAILDRSRGAVRRARLCAHLHVGDRLGVRVVQGAALPLLREQGAAAL